MPNNVSTMVLVPFFFLVPLLAVMCVKPKPLSAYVVYGTPQGSA